ncbi:MAG: type I glutamate--ammonia ligase [Myxococcota bacterium]
MPKESKEIIELVKKERVSFIKLQFTDIAGTIKSVEVPVSQLQKALDGEIAFDGSSIQGFVRIEESDMLLKPDLRTFRIFRWNDGNSDVSARLICDVYNPDGTPFHGCPRLTLKRAMKAAADMGYEVFTGSEAEFFLFLRDKEGRPTTITHDAAGYFDQAPFDLAEDARRKMVHILESLEYEVEASHHEVAPGQHEIDFKYEDALLSADYLLTFKVVVKKVAQDFGLYASFMPKPVAGINGSGMHTHISLFKNGENAFYDPTKPMQVSDTCRHFAAGLLEHAAGMSAITNPTVNSYKRLVPGYEAPTHIAWSERNRSPLVRIPAKRGKGTRLEYRSPDPSSNPYLAMTVMITAGLDGVKRGLTPPPPVNVNVFELSEKERKEYKITSLPGDLSEALNALEKDEIICSALGPHILTNFLRLKREEWSEYIAAVHQWELDRYLPLY